MPTFDTMTGTIDTTTLPPKSLDALLLRGLTHVYGNEASSKVVSAIRSRINPEKPSDVSTDDIKVWREANTDAVAELTRKAHEDFTKALTDGTLGTRSSSGPKVDPLTKEIRVRATSEVVAILRNVGAIGKGEKKYPTLDEVFRLGNQEVTFGDLIARRIANPKEGPRLKKEAEAHLVALARQKARVEAEAEKAGAATSLEEMGL
jgi:hypothetical protein